MLRERTYESTTATSGEMAKDADAAATASHRNAATGGMEPCGIDAGVSPCSLAGKMIRLRESRQ